MEKDIETANVRTEVGRITSGWLGTKTHPLTLPLSPMGEKAEQGGNQGHREKNSRTVI